MVLKALILMLIPLCRTNFVGNSNLELVQILFRHEERSPLRSYANDPYKNHQWPLGWNQLSKRGKLRAFQLGIKLRSKYKTFLNDYYLPSQVLVFSSYADRCHMSAQLLLAGLYPPKREQIWSQDIPWQPIPIPDLPRLLDNKIAMKRPCAAYEAALQAAYKSERIQELNERNKELYDYLSLHSGENIDHIRPLETLYNTLEIEQLNNLTLPEWTTSVFPQPMRDLAAESLAIFTDTPLMKRLSGGVLLKEMLENIRNHTNGLSNKQLYLYSGHDITLVTFMRTLGFKELLKPGFGSSLVVELHSLNVGSKYGVKFIYRDNSEDDGRILQWKSGEDFVNLEEFENGVMDVLPGDWEKECIGSN